MTISIIREVQQKLWMDNKHTERVDINGHKHKILKSQNL